MNRQTVMKSVWQGLISVTAFPVWWIHTGRCPVNKHEVIVYEIHIDK